jgi:putative nucleotidyltransferase with HDIG domain
MVMESVSAIAVISPDHAPPLDVVRVVRFGHRLLTCQLQKLAEVEAFSSDLIIVDLERVPPEQFIDVRMEIERLRNDQPVILIAQKKQYSSLSAAQLLQGNNVVSRPIEPDFLTALIDRLIAANRDQTVEKAQIRKLDLPQAAIEMVQAAKQLAGVLDRVFGVADDQSPISQNELGQTTEFVTSAIRKHGLKTWVDSVRAHHDGTYQHCLLVAGTTVAFGTQFGFSERDMRRITAAALVHDIGKVNVPSAILDKPTALTAEEFSIVKSHTTAGFDIIQKFESFDDEMSDMVLSHHEYLDGSGYPNGLMGGQISDLVRVITIADVFSALIEQRAYKAPKTGKEAYDILRSMQGKLDMPLVKAQEGLMIAI